MKNLLPFLIGLLYFSPALAAPHFIENKGQIHDQHGKLRSDIDFSLQQNDFQLFIGKGFFIWQFQKKENGKIAYNRMEARLLDFNPNAKLVTAAPLMTQYHYYLRGLGKDGAHARSFDKITYKGIYPGIDWEIYINGAGKVEYDFVLQPGANLNQLKMEIKGAEKLSLPGNGSLLAGCALGEVRQALPFAFDEKGRSVACNYVLKENILTFEAAAVAGKWRIDPVLEWGTYFGGEGDELVAGITLNGAGLPLLYGNTNSATQIATAGTFQDTLAAGTMNHDCYLACFDGGGNLIWATYFGGSGSEAIVDATKDNLGNLYVTGSTLSDGLSTPGAFQPTRLPFNTPFIARFSSSGYRTWATYFGSGGSGTSITFSPGEGIYVSGTMSGAGMATPGAHQEAPGGGSDAFLVKMDVNGNRLWSTYYGGSLSDAGQNVITDGAGNVYLCGYSSSTTGIATTGSFQPAHAGNTDAFVTKFTPAGKRVWGTYFGGPAYENNMGLAVQGNKLFLLDVTNSPGMATPGAHQTTLAGSNDFLLSAWDTSGNRLWSTYYGGEGADAAGQAYNPLHIAGNDLLLVGNTQSTTGLIMPGAFMPTPPNTDTWMVLARFGTEGNLIWGTYLGGSKQETVASMVPADSGIIYVTTITKSLSGIATPGTHQPTHGGGTFGFDAALIKLKDETASGITPVFGFTENSSFTLQPNPATEVTLLSGRAQKALGALQITLYDATGSAVWQESIKAGTSFSEPVNISKLPAGNYLLRITGRHTAQTLKLIKQ